MKVLRKNGEMVEVNFEEQEGKKAFWHTSAHVLAQAVKRLYPETKCAIGPAIENGFYYDFQFNFAFSEEHLKTVEAEMRKIVKESLSLQVCEKSREEAVRFMENAGEKYKIELIQELDDAERISFYKQGEYEEFCAGPHISNVCQIKAIKLLSVAGAYWRGSEKNQMLTRIYGISFPKAAQLDEYLQMVEEAKARDHRKLGKELGIFTIFDEGPGLPVFLPKGMILKNLLIDYWRKIHRREGYVEISTPIMLERSLWERSGHWDFYRDAMYSLKVEEDDYAIKPMSCPGGMLVYKREPRSYKELPIRMGELGLVHRNEKSGTLHGLMRVRSFTQDDAHIFMREDQVMDEIQGVMRLIDEAYQKFGFSYEIELSTRPEHSIGSDEDWHLATKALEKAVQGMGKSYVINEGDGAFYGPKLDFHLKDSIGRTWQCGTIQLDFQLPQRFDIEYIGADGKKHRPIMLHRVIFGSIERFIGILLEHYAGKFPAWIAPVQVKILPVSDKYNDYARKIERVLEENDIRAEVDVRSEKLGYKIREARMDKAPYMIIIGENEKKNMSVSVRQRDAEIDKMDMGEMSLEQVVNLVKTGKVGFANSGLEKRKICFEGFKRMVIRKYQQTDCDKLADLFYGTVHTVNAKDYTKEQLSVWATGSMDLQKWNCSLLEHYSLVAIEDDVIVGFGDIDKTGYLDRLYVHKDYQRKGIATAICNELEQTVQGKITTHASITARPFFEKRGYVVLKEQCVERQGITLINYVMEKHR